MISSCLRDLDFWMISYVLWATFAIVHPESFWTQSAFEFCNFLRANAFCVLIKPAQEHARKRLQETAFALMRVNACKLMQIQVHACARRYKCMRVRTLDRIRAHNERSKLIADECHSVYDNYLPRVTRTKLIKLHDRWPCTCNFTWCALNGVHVRAIACTYSTRNRTQTQMHANKRT